MSSINKKTKRVAIALITDHNDNILMGLRRDVGKWANIGGHIEEGEEPYIGMVRECKEEANIDVEDIKLIKVKWDKEKNLLLYLFKIVPDPKCYITAENDPDQEFEILDYIDPNDVADNLHVPIEHNMALKYWIEN